ncbi:MAG TPA: adenylate kinase [Anaerolineales bacterium]|jgi:adenylate kinase
MATYFVMLGPPGVGKGTQAKILSDTTGLPHISSGDLFRENIKNQTDLGKLAKSYMDKGELVPDDVTIDMLRERLSRPDAVNGAILDGFPRTPPQAEVLDRLLAGIGGGQVDFVPYLTAPESVSVERISGRWTCRAKGHIYHQKFNPPKRPGICDVDGSELYQRDDDKAETVRHRIEVYLDQTAPLIQYYRDLGKLIELDGTRSVEQVTAELLSAVEK